MTLPLLLEILLTIGLLLAWSLRARLAGRFQPTVLVLSALLVLAAILDWTSSGLRVPTVVLAIVAVGLLLYALFGGVDGGAAKR